MVKWGLGLDDDSNGQSGEASKSPQESRRLSIQRCIQSLVHACQCRNANCSLPSCQKMKRVVQHTKGCKRKTNGGCPCLQAAYCFMLLPCKALSGEQVSCPVLPEHQAQASPAAAAAQAPAGPADEEENGHHAGKNHAAAIPSGLSHPQYSNFPWPA